MKNTQFHWKLSRSGGGRKGEHVPGKGTGSMIRNVEIMVFIFASATHSERRRKFIQIKQRMKRFPSLLSCFFPNLNACTIHI